jgi:hypothetical protein
MYACLRRMSINRRWTICPAHIDKPSYTTLKDHTAASGGAKMSVKFDIDQFLKENFGSPKGLVNLISAYGLPTPSDSQAIKWFQRGSIPTAWFALLLVVLECELGVPVKLSKYVEL